MESIINPVRDLYSKYKIECILLCLTVTIAIISGIFFFRSQNTDESSFITITESQPVESKKTIYVDIEGAVHKPNMYEVPEGTRLKDLIVLAGGLTNEAEQHFFARNFNLAARLHEQEKIYIPTIQESETSQQSEKNEGSVDGKININSASQEQLESLTGVGKTTADKIISARPYDSLEELVSKKTISKSLFEKIKDQLIL